MRRLRRGGELMALSERPGPNPTLRVPEDDALQRMDQIARGEVLILQTAYGLSENDARNTVMGALLLALGKVAFEGRDPEAISLAAAKIAASTAALVIRFGGRPNRLPSPPSS